MHRRAGRSMQAIAVFAVLVTVVATVVGWRFLGDLERNVDRSLVIGEDAAVTLAETIEVADRLLDSLDDGLATVGASMETIDGTIADISTLATSTADLAGTVAPSFDEVDAALGALEELGGTVDDTLGALSQIPFGPDYDPERDLTAILGDLRASIAPIGADLQSIADELADFASGSGDLQEQLDDLIADLAESRSALAQTDALLDDYRTAAADARDLAVSSRDDLDTSMAWMRVVLVLLAVFAVVSQFVPWWLGSRLVESDDRSVGPLAA